MLGTGCFGHGPLPLKPMCIYFKAIRRSHRRNAICFLGRPSLHSLHLQQSRFAEYTRQAKSNSKTRSERANITTTTSRPFILCRSFWHPTTSSSRSTLLPLTSPTTVSSMGIMSRVCRVYMLFSHTGFHTGLKLLVIEGCPAPPKRWAVGIGHAHQTSWPIYEVGT